MSAKPRKGEVIGTGFFVFRRGKRTGRIAVSPHRMPFEHASEDAAMDECIRLAKANPGETFEVFKSLGTSRFDADGNPLPEGGAA